MQIPSIHDAIDRVQFNWSRDRTPVATIRSGAEVTLAVPDASGGQVVPGCSPEVLANLDFERVNPNCGPIYVEDARPGDVLCIRILRIDMTTFGWTGLVPGMGILADQFPNPWLHIWELDHQFGYFAEGVKVPLEPFCGLIGLALGEPGEHSIVPPRRVGGNLDIKQLGEGTTVYLPVEVEGALLGIGDMHAAQGDGEVCGSAIESPMTVTVEISIRRDFTVEAPEFDVTRPLERPSAAQAGYHATTGVSPDLMAAARQAVERMIVYLTTHYPLSSEEAYVLCSVAVDLKVSEVVDKPNWIVSAFLPNDLFNE
jgi:acetamidase/formamidase